MRIRQAILDEILAHALEEAPDECCGLLIGTAEGVSRSVRARNVRASPTRYQIDPRSHFAAIRQARAVGLEVVGAYHSHPASPPLPSPTDLAEATYPEFLYVIVSPSAPSSQGFRAYRLAERNFQEVELVPEP